MEKLDVANRIKDLRNQKGLSQNTLANLAGVSPTYIYQLERGEKSPTVEYLYYICSALKNFSKKNPLQNKKIVSAISRRHNLIS